MLALFELCISLDYRYSKYVEVDIEANKEIEISGNSLIFIPFTRENWNGTAYISGHEAVNIENLEMLDFGSNYGKIMIKAQASMHFQYTVIPAESLYADVGSSVAVSTDNSSGFNPVSCDIFIVTSPYEYFTEDQCFYLDKNGTMQTGKNVFSNLLAFSKYTLCTSFVSDHRINNFFRKYVRESKPKYFYNQQPKMNQLDLLIEKITYPGDGYITTVSVDSDCSIYSGFNPAFVYVKEKGIFYPDNYSDQQLFQCQYFYENYFKYYGNHSKKLDIYIIYIKSSNYNVNVIDTNGTFDLGKGIFFFPISGEYRIKGLPNTSIISSSGNVYDGQFTQPCVVSMLTESDVTIEAENSTNFTSHIRYYDDYSPNTNGLLKYVISTSNRFTVPKNSLATFSGVSYVAVEGQANVNMSDSVVFNSVPSVYSCRKLKSIRTDENRIRILPIILEKHEYQKVYIALGNDFHISIGKASKGADWNFDENSYYVFGSFEANFNCDIFYPYFDMINFNYSIYLISPHKSYSNDNKRVVSVKTIGPPKTSDSYRMTACLDVNDAYVELKKEKSDNMIYPVGSTMISRMLEAGESIKMSLSGTENDYFIFVHNSQGFEVSGDVKNEYDEHFIYREENTRIITTRSSQTEKIVTIKALEKINLIMTVLLINTLDSNSRIYFTNDVNYVLAVNNSYSTKNYAILVPPGKSTVYSGMYDWTTYTNETCVYYLPPNSGRNFTGYIHAFYLSYLTTYNFTHFEKEWDSSPLTVELKRCSSLCFGTSDIVLVGEKYKNMVIPFSIIGAGLGLVATGFGIWCFLKRRKFLRQESLDVHDLIGSEEDFSMWSVQSSNAYT